MPLNIMFKCSPQSYCAVSEKQMGEIRRIKGEENVDKQKEMKAASVTPVSAWQQSGLCASP